MITTRPASSCDPIRLVKDAIAIWLLALTGCRSGEIINLKWEEVDEAGGCLRLTESKEGASIRPAGQAVFEVLSQIEKKKHCPFVLVSVSGEGPFGGMARAWQRTLKRTQLTGVTPHTLRHSYASVAGDLGFTESTIAALLGHAAGSVTSRYVHHLDSVLVAAADKVARAIFGMMTMDTPTQEGTEQSTSAAGSEP